MKTLLELDDGDCRFPYGDGPFLFCGEPAQDAASYCTFHHAKCWERVRPKLAKARVYHGTDFAA